MLGGGTTGAAIVSRGGAPRDGPASGLPIDSGGGRVEPGACRADRTEG